ncbi:MAG TPA: DUF362 domain-containing protein [Chloroflexota bacterium]|nr:DUF362 domain-containing protein [Chloroflexota bacterium]
MNRPTVALAHCPIDAKADVIDAAVARSVDLIGGVPETIRRARRIYCKPNYVGINAKKTLADVRLHEGRHVHNTEPAVAAAAIRLIREANPSAEIYFGDGLDLSEGGLDADDIFGFMGAREIARAHDVRLLDNNEGEFVQVPVPGGGTIMRKLTVRREIAECDAFVSLAKIKCHQTAGVTLSLKNMFGLLPRQFYGAHNRGFMHQNSFRLMRIFIDINRTFPQTFQVIDGLVGSNHGMNGEPLVSELVMAGTNPVATDCIAMAAMGFDPRSDFPRPPFLISESHILLAEQTGLGPADPTLVDVVGDSVAELTRQYETRPERGYLTTKAAALRVAAREQAAVYLERRDELVDQYAGKYVLLIDGKVADVADTIADAVRMRFFDDDIGYGFATQVLAPSDQIELLEAYAGR